MGFMVRNMVSKKDTDTESVFNRFTSRQRWGGNVLALCLLHCAVLGIKITNKNSADRTANQQYLLTLVFSNLFIFTFTQFNFKIREILIRIILFLFQIYWLMRNQNLYLSILQPDIVWEDKTANLQQYEQMIAGIIGQKQVIVLPEMFSTGFSMAPARLAEQMDGSTVQWMTTMAIKYRCIITGSLIIEEAGKYYNRMLWVQPDGHIGCYDKRHLFAFAGEDQHYTPGNKRMIVSVNGWRINLQVCYDLRFPVWARNQGDEYDILLYVANWPQQRSLAWKTLLQARAIENMCYVVGANRVGKDGKNNNYSGDSSVFGPLGELLWQQTDVVACHTVVLDKNHLQEVRNNFPFLNDSDKYLLM